MDITKCIVDVKRKTKSYIVLPLSDQENDDRQVAYEKEVIDALRQQRKQECFEYTDRGYFWLKAFTDEEIEEIDLWHTAWLKVTETLVIPKLPSCLEETS